MTKRATSRRNRYAATPSPRAAGRARRGPRPRRPRGGERLRGDAARWRSAPFRRWRTSGPAMSGRRRAGPRSGRVAVRRGRRRLRRRRLGLVRCRLVVGRRQSRLVVVVGSSSSSRRRPRRRIVVLVVDSSRRRRRPARPAARCAPHVATSGSVGGSSSGWPGRWRQARITSAGMTNSSDTICAVGTPKNVQLSCAERLERRSGPAPYQTKKSRSRSPGRSRARAWNPSQMRTTAPSTPGQRLVQEERVEERRLAGTRRRTDRRRSDGRSRSGCPTAASSASRTAPG